MFSPNRKLPKYGSLQSTSEKPLERKQRFHYDHLGRQIVAKKDTKPSFKEIIRQQCLTFLLMMARRQIQLNSHKQTLFSNLKINLLSLFHLIDSNNQEYVDAQSMKEYFGESRRVTNVYGSEGRIMFCDIVRMLIPHSYDLRLIQEYQNQTVDLFILQRIVETFKLIAQAEKINLEQLHMIKRDLRLDNLSTIFESLFIDRKNLDRSTLTKMFEQVDMSVSQEQLEVIMFKMDKKGKLQLDLDSFSGYF